MKNLLQTAFLNRSSLIQRLAQEETDSYRLFHGVSEGYPGLTVDRYGDLVLIQSFREILSAETIRLLLEFYREVSSSPPVFAYQHRGRKSERVSLSAVEEGIEETNEFVARESGLKFHIQARHQGLDPWLFLDLRVGRRKLREQVKQKSVLNLFAYTCSAGVFACAGGASEVWNVDFASSSLEVGRRNARLNGFDEGNFRIIQEDCLPVLRQLADLPVGLRRSQKRNFVKFEPREFDFVFLDPPAFSKSAFGAVDVAKDYPSLFKPAVLATRTGGQILATNNLASVSIEDWVEVLKRCAAKAGRPIRELEILSPEEDFPSFDGRHPLKIAWCRV